MEAAAPQLGGAPERIGGTGRVRSGSISLLLDACLAGIGIARLPLHTALVHGQGRLEAVLPKWQPQPAAVHAVFPRNRFVALKVRAFIDHALEHFDPPPG